MERLLVLGTSNSVLRTGWVSGLRAARPDYEIVDRSLGASPGSMFGLYMGEDLSSYAAVIFDSVPNDEQVEQGRVVDIQARTRFFYELFATIASQTRLILIGFTNAATLNSETDTYSRRRQLAALCGAQFIDIRSLVLELGPALIGPDKELYEHPAHPNRDIARAVGFEIGVALTSFAWPLLTSSIETFSGNFRIVDPADLVEEEKTIVLRNSLINMRLTDLRRDDIVRFDAGGSCIGFMTSDFLGTAIRLSNREHSRVLEFSFKEVRKSFEVKFYEIPEWRRVDYLEVIRSSKTTSGDAPAVLGRFLFWLGDVTAKVPDQSLVDPNLLHEKVADVLRSRVREWSTAILAHRRGHEAAVAGNKQQAYEMLKTAVAHDPNHAEALHRLSHVCISLGRLDESGDLLGRLRVTYPNELRYMHDHARVLIQLGHVWEAKTLLEAVYDADPNRIGLYADLERASTAATTS
jgi:tetratricopeptide (TPR) repeat protein